MDLHHYLTDVLTTTELANRLDVPPALVSQWRTKVRPVPAIRAARIEQVTNGVVTRRELRPDDWGDIWPELIDAEHPWPAHREAA